MSRIIDPVGMDSAWKTTELTTNMVYSWEKDKMCLCVCVFAIFNPKNGRTVTPLHKILLGI